MNFSKLNCHLNSWCVLKHIPGLIILGSLPLLLSTQLQAQVAIDPGIVTTPVVPTTTVPTTTATGGTTTDITGGQGVDLDGASALDFGGIGSANINQGFVGATAPGVAENNFIGAASQTFGALAEGATFGGGVNDGDASSIPGGGGGGGNAGGGGQGGAGGFTGGTTSGSVIRGSLRTRLRPAFAAPIIPSQDTEFSFNDNLARQPSSQSLVGRYQVSVQNRTATVTGLVNSQADADRLIRQLRLQPGIYGIVNQLQVIR